MHHTLLSLGIATGLATFLALPLAAQEPPQCTEAREGQLACMAGKQCACRFIPGGKHYRIDDWHFTVPPEVARDVATINFHSTPSAKGIEHRIRMNQGDIREDVDALKAGAAKGLEAIHRISISEVSPEAPWQSGFAGAPKARCLACLPLPP
jgi:hypothetical protein